VCCTLLYCVYPCCSFTALAPGWSRCTCGSGRWRQAQRSFSSLRPGSRWLRVSPHTSRPTTPTSQCPSPLLLGKVAQIASATVQCIVGPRAAVTAPYHTVEHSTESNLFCNSGLLVALCACCAACPSSLLRRLSMGVRRTSTGLWRIQRTLRVTNLGSKVELYINTQYSTTCASFIFTQRSSIRSHALASASSRTATSPLPSPSLGDSWHLEPPTGLHFPLSLSLLPPPSWYSPLPPSSPYAEPAPGMGSKSGFCRNGPGRAGRGRASRKLLPLLLSVPLPLSLPLSLSLPLFLSDQDPPLPLPSPSPSPAPASWPSLLFLKSLKRSENFLKGAACKKGQ